VPFARSIETTLSACPVAFAICGALRTVPSGSWISGL
jgi:hypothetical protein